MKGRLFGFLALALAAGSVLACKEDPTGSLAGSPTRLLVNPNPLFLNEGVSGAIEASVVDAQLTPLRATIAATSGSPGVVTVTPDNTAPDPSGRTQRFTVRGISPGQVVLNLTGGGLSTGDTVNVMPLAFNGIPSTLTPTSGDTLVIRATPFLKFEPESVAVTFGGGVAPTLVSATVDSLILLVPYVLAGGPLTIEGVAVSYVEDLFVTLPSSFTITPAGDNWTGDDAIATAPTLPLPAAAGDTTYVLTNTTAVANSATCPEVVLGFGSTGPCMIYRFTLAAPRTLEFQVDWDGTADVDIYVCPDADPGNCFEDGGAGAGASHPERTNAAFTAGDHYLFIETYVGTPPRNVYIRIRGL